MEIKNRSAIPDLLASALLLAALLLCLSAPAFAGSGCGSNWMGDTSGDTDFFVSNNQNLAASGAPSSTGSSAASAASASAPAAASASASIGSAAGAGGNATITDVLVDRPSPQSPGAVIVWTVDASNPGGERMLYDFLLRGPATEGAQRDMTGWIEENAWSWNTTGLDLGENQIEVRVMRANSSDFEDSRRSSYTIAIEEGSAPASSGTQSGSASGTDSGTLSGTESGTASGTGSVTGSGTASGAEEVQEETGNSGNASTSTPDDADLERPRVAPDERRATVAQSSGPNMQMPDPSPKPNSQTQGGAVEASVVADTVAVPETPDLEVEGKWSIRLDPDEATINPVSLIQTDKSIMGMGTMNDAGSKLQVNVKGSVDGDAVSLEIWTVISEYGNRIDKSIDLQLSGTEQALSGEYTMYSGEELIGRGNATASRMGS